MQILCPTPVPFATVQLRRDLGPLIAVLSKYGVPIPATLHRNAPAVTTPAVPACSHAMLKQQHVPHNTRKQKLYAFDIAACSAVTEPASREHLVEWIEYHRIVGVQHFVLYDVTARRGGDTGTSLRALVADYITEGIVTVVPWPYQDCTKQPRDGGDGGDISMRTALASCYARHRRSARFILAAATDDFVTLSEGTWDYYSEGNEDVGTGAEVEAKKHAAQRRRLLRSLFNFARFVLHANREMPALRFQPVFKYACPEEPAAATGRPPRVGRWPASALGDAEGGVLLIRTDVVQVGVSRPFMYLTQRPLSNPPLRRLRGADVFRPPRLAARRPVPTHRPRQPPPGQCPGRAGAAGRGHQRRRRAPLRPSR